MVVRVRALVAAAWAVAVPGLAAEQERADPDAIEEIVVVGDLGSMPGEDVQTVFGFGKSLLATPRSVSTVTDEMIDRFNMRDIDELIALAPGSFTQSFFGVAGSLDIRGTPGETYFRGVRRLDNPGNYPTPIGASDRVDIVRGPASPIHGPAKIGGYLNFKPKSARIEETGQFIEDRTGAIGLDFGSWDKRILSGEAGGPGQLGGQDFGYYFYGEFEDSGSFYRDTDLRQTLLQASFDTDLSARLALQFGGMFHDHSSNQVAGWNRLTQELVDHGTYLTGSPSPLDRDGDGYVSHQEFDVDGDGFTDLNPFAAGLVPGTSSALDPEGPFPGACFIGDTTVFSCRADLLALRSIGMATLDPSQVLTWPDDVLEAEVLTLYFDVIFDTDGGWEWKNQLFHESYDTLGESGYGFSQFHDTSVVEDRLVVAKEFRLDAITAAVQLSPSLRFTRFRHGDDYTNEYFDRRDLTQAPSGLDTRLLATQIDDDYTEYYIGDYLDLGIAALTSIDWERGFSVLAGLRYDSIDMQSRQPIDKLLLPSSNNFCLPPGDCVDEQASATVDGVSWTLSLSYDLPGGLVPYLTASEQATVIAGQGGEINTTNIAEGTAFDTSKLSEAGLKGELLDGGLYFALATYVQERTDFSAQSIVNSQATETEGVEFELRWVASERLLLTFGYSRIEVVNLNTLEAGSRFSFIGADDVPGIPPEALYGGALGGVLIRPGEAGARRAGIPENILSLTATYDFGNGLAASVSVVDADAVHSGFSGAITLPAYTLVNLGLVFEQDRFSFGATLKNATNERYFRANFPNLFGGVIVLPELPRHLQARLRYRW